MSPGSEVAVGARSRLQEGGGGGSGGEGRVTHHGDDAVRARLHELNSDVRSREHQPQASDEQVLTITAPITALADYDSDNCAQLVLLDTPGTNEAGEEGLRHLVGWGPGRRGAACCATCAQPGATCVRGRGAACAVCVCEGPQAGNPCRGQPSGAARTLLTGGNQSLHAFHIQYFG